MTKTEFGTQSTKVNPKVDLIRGVKKLVAEVGSMPLCATCDTELTNLWSCYCPKCEAELYR